jgi:predicted RNase H-like HicB family nuclease
MSKYAIEIFYSEEDEGYIAEVPELPECSAFGESEEEAFKEVKVAMGLLLETAEREGREIPKPEGKVLLKRFYEETIALRSKRTQETGI